MIMFLYLEISLVLHVFKKNNMAIPYIANTKIWFSSLPEKEEECEKSFIDTRNYLLRFFIKGYKGVYYGIYWYLLKGNIK